MKMSANVRYAITDMIDLGENISLGYIPIIDCIIKCRIGRCNKNSKTK